MPRLEDLMKDISSMSSEELTAFVRGLRADRKISRKIERKTTKTSRVKQADKLKALLDSMPKEELARLLKEKASK